MSNVYLNFTSGNEDKIDSLSDAVNSLSAKVNGTKSSGSNNSSNQSNQPQSKPVNIFPNYWVKQTSYGPHKDAPTFNVSVEEGKQYTLSFMVADDTDNANLAIRAASNWNITDEWGDIVSNDSGASGNKAIYHITFTAPKSGDMPINFMFCRQASAMSAGISVIMIQRITMTQTDHYVPYEQCDNSKQSLKDVTGDGGMDAKAMFGNL